MPSILLAAPLLLNAAAMQSFAGDPFAATAPGWAHCFEPRESDKTCESIVSYRALGNGAYETHAISGLDHSDTLVEFDQRISFGAGKTCEFLSRSNLLNVRFRKGERYLDGREALVAGQKLDEFYKGIKRVRSCTVISGVSPDLTASTEVSGELRPGYYFVLRKIEKHLRWIHVDDGFTVRSGNPLKV